MSETEVLSHNLKKIRKEMGETQLVFALNCGLSEDEISHLENGSTDPKLSTLQSIAAYTGLTVAQLLDPKMKLYYMNT